MLTIDANALAAMRVHAEESFPEECCGVLFSTPEGQVVRRITNTQNRLHAVDRVAYPRDARMAYHMDDDELQRVNRDGDQPGWGIVLFYHSHPQHDAYFSATDRAQALFGGMPDAGPSYPGVAWVVVSVYDRSVRDVQAYAWNEDARDFDAVPFAVA